MVFWHCNKIFTTCIRVSKVQLCWLILVSYIRYSIHLKTFNDQTDRSCFESFWHALNVQTHRSNRLQESVLPQSDSLLCLIKLVITFYLKCFALGRKARTLMLLTWPSWRFNTHPKQAICHNTNEVVFPVKCYKRRDTKIFFFFFWFIWFITPNIYTSNQNALVITYIV